MDATPLDHRNRPVIIPPRDGPAAQVRAHRDARRIWTGPSMSSRGGGRHPADHPGGTFSPALWAPGCPVRAHPDRQRTWTGRSRLARGGGRHPRGHPNRAGYLSGLGTALSTRFERTGMIGDLDRAIIVTQRAVDVTPRVNRSEPDTCPASGRPVYPVRHRGGRGCGPGDHRAQQAVDAPSPSGPGRRPVQPGDRAAAPVRGALGCEDLDRAVEVVQGLPLRSRTGPNTYPAGAALRSRFEHCRRLEDLDRAVAVGEEALDATPEGHPDRAMLLSGLE